ncbi:porin family protein [Hymenobacter sp. HD11105]
MEKSLWSCLLLASIAYSAHAQGVQFGVKAGVGEATYIGHRKELLEAEYQADMHAIHGFYGGLSLTIPFRHHPFFAFQPELVYVRHGFELARKVRPYTWTERDSYLELPLLVRYTRYGFFAEAGLQVGYFLHNRSHINDGGTPYSYSLRPSPSETLSKGITVGVGYQLRTGPLAGIRYTVGSARSAFSTVLSLYSGYTFGRPPKR